MNPMMSANTAISTITETVIDFGCSRRGTISAGSRPYRALDDDFIALPDGTARTTDKSQSHLAKGGIVALLYLPGGNSSLQ